MPRDQRLYMTFPIDFHRHPKIARLSDAAFRAFVEANGESRLAESDGRLEAEDAEFLWKPDVLAELVASHPTRPVMLRDGSAYVLRDYAEHQFTKADRDELREKRSKAGKASAEKRSTRVEQVLSKTQHPATESESESGIEISTKTSKSQSSSNRANDSTDSAFTSDTSRRLAAQAGIEDADMLSGLIRTGLGVTVPHDRLRLVVEHLRAKSKKPIGNLPAYLATCMAGTSGEELRKFIHDNNLAD